MKDFINLSNSLRSKISFIDEQTAANKIRNYDKRWSFSNIYYLTEFRDVYLALEQFKFNKFPSNFKKVFTEYCLSINLPFVKSSWEERRILEYLNAFRNFSLVDENYKSTKHISFESKIGESPSGITATEPLLLLTV
jgi:hypothetical protein